MGKSLNRKGQLTFGKQEDPGGLKDVLQIGVEGDYLDQHVA